MSKKNLLRLPQAIKRTGLSRSSIYLAINAGTFPKPIKLSERCIAFIESEIDEWIEVRIIQSRSEGEAA